MNSLLRKKILYTGLTLSLITTLFLCSCEKNIDNIADPNDNPDLVTKVISSVSGFVTDENNTAVQGASVKAGMATTSTNEYGYFELKNVEVVKTAAVVTVSHTGYFKGTKTYIATAGKAAFFRIKLIPKTISGTINSASGGDVSLSNGLNISLPASAVVNMASGAAYSGTVNVAAHWIDPTSTDLNQVMPGDLRGVDNLARLKRLTTYGMVAVELTGSAGELLQVANDKRATLTMPVPASILASAPSSIPLWYFDENTGLWKEEGTAVKTGNTYVGEVSHFSFWNCDTPNSYIQFDCTVVDGNGQPVPFAIVKISVAGNAYNTAYGYTDSSGYVSGPVPDNAQLVLDVYVSLDCGNSVFTQNFSTTSSNISLGNIVINTANSTASVSGTVTDCLGNSVTNGYIIMIKNNIYYRYGLSSSGTFNFNALLCSGGNPNASFIAEDNVSGQQSNPLNYTLVTGANAIGNLQACGVSITQVLNYNINGTAYNYISPADTFYHYINSSANPLEMAIGAQHIAGTPGYGGYAFTSAGIGAGSTQNLTNIYFSQLPQGDSLRITTPVNVNITEYGNVGQFIAGNFSGTFTGLPPANTVYNITSNFRVRRLQ